VETLEALKRRMDTAESLRDLVSTMKALAAVSIRRYERSVAALADYDHAIDLGLPAVLRPRTAPPQRRRGRGRTGALVIGSDQGLCGTFNEQVVSRLLHDIVCGVEALVEPGSP
jgi:F-type H+-transporting ATPase subunit gamma